MFLGTMVVRWQEGRLLRKGINSHIPQAYTLERTASISTSGIHEATGIHTHTDARTYALELDPVGVAARVVLLCAEVGAVVDDVVAQGHLDLVLGDIQLKGGVRLER